MRTPLDHVIVATDFTRHAHEAAARAAWLPLRPGGGITLVHAVPTGVPSTVQTRLEAAAAALMRGVQATLEGETRRAGGPARPISTVIAHGAPAECVARVAAEHRAGLIVIGHGERRTLGERLLGSTAERIVRSAEHSVLVVTHAPESPYRKVLAAVDLSDGSRRAVELGSRVLDPTVSSLDVLHVYDVPYVELLRSGGMSAPEIEQYLLETEASAQSLLTQWVPSLRELAVTPQPLLRRGDPRRVIVEQAAAARADLIAVGHHARSMVGTLLLGSVAEAVVRRATRDVLVAC